MRAELADVDICVRAGGLVSRKDGDLTAGLSNGWATCCDLGVALKPSGDATSLAGGGGGELYALVSAIQLAIGPLNALIIV